MPGVGPIVWMKRRRAQLRLSDRNVRVQCHDPPIGGSPESLSLSMVRSGAAGDWSGSGSPGTVTGQCRAGSSAACLLTGRLDGPSRNESQCHRDQFASRRRRDLPVPVTVTVR